MTSTAPRHFLTARDGGARLTEQSPLTLHDGSTALPVLTVMTVESFLSRANANWTAPAFVGGVLLAVGFLVAKAPRWLPSL